jgi:uncharacterized membrane protein
LLTARERPILQAVTRGRAIPMTCVGVLVVLSVVRTTAVWAELPDVMASHFGPSGRPDGWQSKTAFFGLYVAISVFTLWSLLLVAQLLRVIPVQSINIPHRDYWLVPERRDEAMRMLTSSMDWLAVALAVVLAGALELVIRANLARMPLDNTLMVALLASFLVFQVAWLIHLWRRFKPAP